MLAGLYWQSLELYRELAAELPGSFRLDARPAGLLYVGPAAADSAARGLAAAWTAAYPDTGAELVTGTALRNLDPALAYDLVACRLDIGYPAAPASATRAYAALAERLGASIVIGGDARLAVRDGVAVGVEVDGRLVEAGSVVVAAGPWSPDVLTAVGATSPAPWPPIRRSWGVVAAIDLARPPRHVLEEIDIDIEPDDGGDGSAARDEGFGFSLVTADGSSALGSTFLPEPPEPTSVVEPPARTRRPIRPGDRVDAGRRNADVRPPGQPRRPSAPRRDPGIRNAFVAAGHGAVGDLDRPGLGPARRGPRPGTPRRDPAGARPGALRGARRNCDEPLAPALRVEDEEPELRPALAERLNAELQTAPLRRRRVDEAAIDDGGARRITVCGGDRRGRRDQAGSSPVDASGRDVGGGHRGQPTPRDRGLGTRTGPDSRAILRQ